MQVLERRIIGTGDDGGILLWAQEVLVFGQVGETFRGLAKEQTHKMQAQAEETTYRFSVDLNTGEETYIKVLAVEFFQYS